MRTPAATSSLTTCPCRLTFSRFLQQHSYIADVKNVLTTKEGMMPGHTYQDDLKFRFKELMRKNPAYRTLTGEQLMKCLDDDHPDENPFRGAQYVRCAHGRP